MAFIEGKKRDGCGVILTYHCNSECAHCLYACSPRRTSVMDRPTMRLVAAWIADTEWASTEVHVGGGEPFLFLDSLVQLCTELDKASIRVAFIETNGFWGRCPDRYIPTLCMLRDVGVQGICVGMSPFHAPAIPVDDALVAAETARDIFGDEGCSVEHEWFSELSVPACRHDPQKVSDPTVLTQLGISRWDAYLRSMYGLVVGGRVGFSACRKLLLQGTSRELRVPCCQELRPPCHCHIDPSGAFIPDICTGVALGDIQEQGLVVSSASETGLVAELLIEGGASLLADWAAEEHGFQRNPEGYFGKCHLCVDVRLYLWSQGLFHGVLRPPAFYEELCRK